MSGGTVPSFSIPKDGADMGCNVDQHFSKAELEKISPYEKKSLQNMKRNYLMLLSFGLPATKPEFMKGPSARKRKLVKIQSDSESDEEWTPSLKGKKDRVGPVMYPFLQHSVGHDGSKTKKSKNGNVKRVKTEKFKKSPASAPYHPCYPKRSKTPPNYMNIEVPDDDSFLFCDECNTEHDGDCPEYGALETVEDAEITTGDKTKSADERSLPDCLCLKPSTIPQSGQGIFAKQQILARTRFGPYEGKVIKDVDQAHSSGYAWQIYKDRKPSDFVDASDPQCSNWMRFVNCARTEAEQNLTAFQYKGQVYYRSHVNIDEGEELLVWYGAEYGTELGIKRMTHSKPGGDVYTIVDKSGETCFCCRRCPDVQFMSEKYLLSHMKYKHQVTVPLNWRDKLSNKLSRGIGTNWCERRLNSFNPGGTKSQQNEKTQLLKHKVNNLKDDNNNRTDRGSKPFRCAVCDYRCNWKSHLDLHMRTHTGEKPFKCTMCDYSCSRKGHLDLHMRTHTGEKPFKCTICDYRCSVKISLDRHVRTHTCEKPFKCTLCDRCSRKDHLDYHMRTHNGEKPFKCTMCDYRCSVKISLDRHVRTHTCEKPFKCTMCDYRCSRKDHLDHHMRTHTGEKPFTCTMCDYRCSVKISLDRHVRTHTCEKPFKCTMCDYRCSRKDHLDHHMRTHTGEKPFKCTMCDYRCSVKISLDRHVRTHTCGKPFQCTRCDYRCSMKINLDEHIRTCELVRSH